MVAAFLSGSSHLAGRSGSLRTFDGKQKTLSGGIYPDTSLSQARAWRDRNKRLIAGGTDPSYLLEERKFQRRANALTEARSTPAAPPLSGLLNRSPIVTAD